jgi:ribonuclease P protein component
VDQRPGLLSPGSSAPESARGQVGVAKAAPIGLPVLTPTGQLALTPTGEPVPAPAGKLGPAHRLVRQQDLQRALRKGRRVQGPHLQLVAAYQPRSGGDSVLPAWRLGLAVSKGVGHAPARARMRRLLRESFRALRSKWPRAHDIVIVARVPWPEADLTQVVAELRGLSRLFDTPPRPRRSGPA